jgi:hypothetical protein
MAYNKTKSKSRKPTSHVQKPRKSTYKHKTTKKNKGSNNKKRDPKWVTALAAAHKSLVKTGSVKKAKETLRRQALANAKKLFGRNLK